MHPSKFFDEVKILDKNIRFIGADKDVVEMLKNVHPMNWIGSDVSFQIVKAIISYDTDKGNRKIAEKYSIQKLDLSLAVDLEVQAQIQAEADIGKFLIRHLHTRMKNYKVENAEIVALAVLQIE